MPSRFGEGWHSKDPVLTSLFRQNWVFIKENFSNSSPGFVLGVKQISHSASPRTQWHMLPEFSYIVLRSNPYFWVEVSSSWSFAEPQNDQLCSEWKLHCWMQQEKCNIHREERENRWLIMCLQATPMERKKIKNTDFIVWTCTALRDGSILNISF